eukprot:m.25093 g.25093  ORF g.25093 m.25093 type:complete len:78 (+) comp36954_c0_seq1:605-838(+)
MVGWSCHPPFYLKTIDSNAYEELDAFGGGELREPAQAFGLSEYSEPRRARAATIERASDGDELDMDQIDLDQEDFIV